jgi:subtilase family serine protease
VGLSDRPRFHTNVTHAPTKLGDHSVSPVLEKTAAKSAYPAFGVWTAQTFAKYYGADPLYKKGVTGKGKTLAIVTLASFTPADAYLYWKDIGLTVSQSRIKVVNVDGGPGVPSDLAGSDETTLDVEQSGGVAPGANIIVYQAPNTTQGFIDAFAQAADDNTAESISCSWGEWEWFDNLENSPATDPVTGKKDVSDLTATHDVLVKSGSQGQSMFTAAGDAGAYDVNREYGTAEASLTLSVDYPASDPAITAAGGTTLPGRQVFEDRSTGKRYAIRLSVENAWSWKYLDNFCTAIGYPLPINCGIFPVGGGGGVSVFWPRPSYQTGLSTFRNSEPDQQFIYYGSIPTELVFRLPGHYAGRNVPDISSNADPDTGYEIYYTSNVNGFGVIKFYGGTSFVAPQFNGVAALLEQNAGGRIGFLNPFLYKLAAKTGAYDGPAPSLNYVTAGDNDFWASRKGYTVATGLGTIEIKHLADQYNLTK